MNHNAKEQVAIAILRNLASKAMTREELRAALEKGNCDSIDFALVRLRRGGLVCKHGEVRKGPLGRTSNLWGVSAVLRNAPSEREPGPLPEGTGALVASAIMERIQR